MRRRLIVIPLGEVSNAEARAVAKGLQDCPVDWLDRAELRRQPLVMLARLLRRRYTAAALVAPDLDQPRLRLTSLLLALPRAEQRWRLDLRGRGEPFSTGRHLRISGPVLVRHLAACGLALLLARPLLGLLESLLGDHPPRLSATRPRRILYLRSQLWFGLQGGGSVAHTAGVIGGLQHAGVEVAVVSSDALPGVTAPIRIQPPEHWFDGWLREAEELAYNVAFCAAALRVARQWRPDAIYQRHTAFGVGGAVLARILGVPLVLEFNSSEVWKGRHWGGLRLERIAEQVERINLRAADRVVVVSRALRDQLLAAHPTLEPEKMLINPNGVDPTQFQPSRAGNHVRNALGLQASLVVGFSGTFGAWHGIPTLAAALPKVLGARPEVRWLLIGDGPLRPLVDRVVATDGLHGRVALPGLVPHAAMPDYLAACDVLVSPHGRQADGAEFFGSPTKLYEYMAAGRPIVASAVGQIAEVLVDGESALLVPPDDPDALVGAILRLVDDPGLRLRLGCAARERAERCHTWRQNAERLLDGLTCRRHQQQQPAASADLHVSQPTDMQVSRLKGGCSDTMPASEPTLADSHVSQPTDMQVRRPGGAGDLAR